MFLGIEIGGTKLQLAAGRADGSPLAETVRLDVDPSRGAAGILEQIEQAAPALIAGHDVRRIGIGFGGPLDVSTGRTIKSHQVAGWDDLPLIEWCQQKLGLPTVAENDCNVAALAEARLGAGAGANVVFYVTVGTGVGGGLVVGGKIFGAGRPAVAEIGHLRPGLLADRPDATVESIASGLGIAARAQYALSGRVLRPSWLGCRRREGEEVPLPEQKGPGDVEPDDQQSIADLLDRCEGRPETLSAETVARAAADGNRLARECLSQATETLGWAVAQTVALAAPEVIVVGGGVSLIGEPLFFAPLREQVRRYVFPPLADSYRIVPAALGQSVVLVGAILLAADAE